MAKTITKEAYKELDRGMASLDQIQVSGNFRKTFNQERLRELAENIRQVGVLEPILTRPLDSAEGTMVLVAGARRLEATRMAGRAEIPYRLLDLTEEQANEVQALENLHREQLNPIEEAQAFKTLLDQGAYTPEDLAGRVSKSVAYVYRAVKLLELPENAQAHIACGDFTPSHGHKLLQLPAEAQAKMIQWLEDESESGTNWPTVGALSREIEYTHGRTLSGVCFPTDTDYAGTHACTNCPHNTAAQSMLFDAQGDGQCLSPECFAGKLAAFDQEIATAAAEEYKGMKYLGVLEWRRVYLNNTNVRKYGKAGLEIDAILRKRPEVKSALKKTPEKFGYCVSKDDHKVKLLVTDKELIAALFPEREQEQEAKETPEQKEARKKQEFIQAKIAGALVMEFLTNKKPLPDQLVVDLAPNFMKKSIEEVVLAAFKLKEWGENTAKKIPARDLLKVAWLHKVTDYDGIDVTRLKCAGIDFKGIKDKAAAAAKAAWPAELERQQEQQRMDAIKAAAAKHNGKQGKTKQEPEEEDPGMDEGDDE